MGREQTVCIGLHRSAWRTTDKGEKRIFCRREVVLRHGRIQTYEEQLEVRCRGGSMLLSILLLAAQAEQMGAIVFEPQPATPWVETFSASCGGQHLEILRPMRPLENGPKVLVNGRPANGDVRSLELEFLARSVQPTACRSHARRTAN